MEVFLDRVALIGAETSIFASLDGDQLKVANICTGSLEYLFSYFLLVFSIFVIELIKTPFFIFFFGQQSRLHLEVLCLVVTYFGVYLIFDVPLFLQDFTLCRKTLDVVHIGVYPYLYL